MSLGAKVAQNPSISYITYSGNKQVCARDTWCSVSSSRVENPFIQLSLLFKDGVMLCKATAGMSVPVSVSPCIGATRPFIIFDSADIDSAVDEVMEAAFKKKKEVIHIKKLP